MKNKRVTKRPNAKPMFDIQAIVNNKREAYKINGIEFNPK